MVNGQAPTSTTLTKNEAFTSIASDTIGNEPPPTLTPKATEVLLSDRTFILSICVLAFGLFVILIIFFIGKNESNPEGVYKLTTVTLVITSALFLVIAGYSSEQIAPVIGLLGTIAGYLLGKASDSGDKKS